VAPSRRSRRLGALAIVGLLLLAAGGWWLRRPVGVSREPGLSVLLVTLDTLRADRLGAYGDALASTPWMDRLAAAGVRFDAAHAHNVVTLPSHANILSGRLPFEHGVRDNSGFRFPPALPTLASLLRARGYRTGAFVSAFALDSRFGLDRGFETYDDEFVDAQARPAFLVQERRGAETVARARRWLAEQNAHPFLCWVHLFEPHAPYEPGEPVASRFTDDPYRGEVAAVDAALGPLLKPVLAEADAGRVLVVLTSDHGESLGEHGEATHGIFAYESTLRVPLILYQPRLLAPRVVSAPARHVDLLPTILDALSLPVPEGLPGRSLLAAAGGASVAPTTSYFEALSGQLNRGWAPLTGLIRDGIKYIELPIPELYDLRRDGQEARNLAGAQPQRLEELRGLLAALRDADRPVSRAGESADTQERLGALGYVAAAHPGRDRYGEQDDPKRLIELDAILHEIVALHGRGELPAALARCRELVRRRPEMSLSLLYLAQLERERGDLEAAIAALQQASARNPSDTVALTLLGAYLTQAGRAREAARLLEPVARRETPDVEALLALALAQARSGQWRQALATLGRAREADPSNGLVLVNTGTVHLMSGDEASARAAFEEALSLNPSLARAHSSLGMITGERGQLGAALEHWKRAVALDPRECEKLLALGRLLDQRGRQAEARPYLELFLATAPARLHARELAQVRERLAAQAPGRAGGE
jgi:arylsulfatase A-like enzyme/Flp pilus assembly protein TadD